MPCQLMVIGAYSMPTGVPKLKYGEGGDFIQCKQLSCDTTQLWNHSIVIQFGCRTVQLWDDSSIIFQLNYDTEQLWNSVAVRWPWGKVALVLQLNPSAPLWSDPTRQLKWYSSSQGNSLQWIKLHSPSQRRADSYKEKFVLLQLRTPNSHGFIGSKSTCPVRMELLWLVSEDVNKNVAAQLQWDGEHLSLTVWSAIPETPSWGLVQRAGTECDLLPEVQLEGEAPV